MHPLDNASVSAVGQFSFGKPKEESSLSSVMKNKRYSVLAESLTIIICEDSRHERYRSRTATGGPAATRIGEYAHDRVGCHAPVLTAWSDWGLITGRN